MATRTKRTQWSTREDAVLRKLYPEGGARAVADKLTTRSLGAIRRRARLKGIIFRNESIRRSKLPGSVPVSVPEEVMRTILEKIGHGSLAAYVRGLIAADLGIEIDMTRKYRRHRRPLRRPDNARRNGAIRSSYARGGKVAAIAERYGLSRAAVYKIINHRTTRERGLRPMTISVHGSGLLNSREPRAGGTRREETI